jgi:hypothetical protein
MLFFTSHEGRNLKFAVRSQDLNVNKTAHGYLQPVYFQSHCPILKKNKDNKLEGKSKIMFMKIKVRRGLN